jgi:hypothetical protein
MEGGYTVKILEVDYFAHMDQGIRNHVRTARIEVPDDTPKDRLPFLLTAKIGKHEGIRRVKCIGEQWEAK